MFCNRYNGSYDGVSAYDAEAKTLTTIFGGSEDNALIVFNNLDTLSSSKTLRVRLERIAWEYTDPSNVQVKSCSDFGMLNLNYEIL